MTSPLPSSIDETASLLAKADYVAGRDLSTVLFLALRMRRPLFLEGDRVYIEDDHINGLFDVTVRITTGNAGGGTTVVGELIGGIARYVFLVSDLELITEEASSHA